MDIISKNHSPSLAKPQRESWQDRAKCAEIGAAPFFLDIPGSTYVKARAICNECVVRLKCLAYALDLEKAAADKSEGMFGGKTPDERRILNGYLPRKEVTTN